MTMEKSDRWLVVIAAALGWDLLQRRSGTPRPGGSLSASDFRRAESLFPALTCPFQSTLRTALPPSGHGVWLNGLYDRRLARPTFWEQHAGLSHGLRVWNDRRAGGARVALLFWQQSLGESADLVLSPRPVHRHHGGMIQDCLDRPAGVYAELCADLGGPFPLHRYWGPAAGAASSRWIADATRALMARKERAPDLLFTYLPHLDYDLQRYGPDSPQAIQALDETLSLLSNLWMDATARGYRVLITGDYSIAPVTRPPAFPLRALREAGLFETHAVRGRVYPDFFHSRAVALCDHELAAVYARDAESARAARDALERMDGFGGFAECPPPAGRPAWSDQSPDFIVLAEPGSWCAYPWWDSAREAPDYAGHVDIHNKPGYDPCELFWGWPPGRISANPARVRGTHGRGGPGRDIAWAVSDPAGWDDTRTAESLARTLARQWSPASADLLKGIAP